MVLGKLRNWGTEVGEIKITEDLNPIISIQITGVDTDPILASVASEDNPGNRRRLVRTMLFEMLGLPENDDLFENIVEYGFSWRGTRRQVNVSYENVRELSDQKLRNQDGAWSVIIDFPFDDEPNRGPRDDIARIQEFQARHDGRADTIVWLPSHLSGKAARDLGTLARLNYVLTGDQRFADHARHLSAIDRDQARALLTNQRSQLQQRMRAYLEVAYGIADEPRDAVDKTLDGSEHLISLNGFKPAMPVGATIKAAFDKLLDQLFTYQFPAHPLFDGEVNYRAVRGLDRTLFRKLATCQWIRDHRHLILCGKTGLGKSWLACALGHQACREDISVLYHRVPRLFAALDLARGDGRYAKLLASLARVDLLILDDWGSPLTPDHRRDLMEIVEDRYGRGSLLITSQVPVDHWHEIIGDPTIADAILDRIIHTAYRIDLSGESLRKPEGGEEQA